MDKDFLTSVVLSVVTRALGQVSAGLVAAGWVTEDQATKLILYVSGGIVSLFVYGYVWVRNKQMEKLKNTQIKVALQASPSTPVEVVKTDAAAVIADEKGKL